MKVYELLAEDIGYDNEKKQLEGTAKEWMQAIGATPADIAEARKRVAELPSYADVSSMMKDTSTATQKKNGTFQFRRKDQDRSEYTVYANGQIRTTSEHWLGGKNQTKLVSPKPRLKHGDVVESLVMIYDRAFKELAKKAKKANDSREARMADTTKYRQKSFA